MGRMPHSLPPFHAAYGGGDVTPLGVAMRAKDCGKFRRRRPRNGRAKRCRAAQGGLPPLMRPNSQDKLLPSLPDSADPDKALNQLLEIDARMTGIA